MGAKETDFNVLQFEKKLTTLKDSQDSINSCCQWCLSNRQHHKKIVNSWLNVLKRVKVEHRLVLFYLANDVIQYSKRKKYEYVESWGTALQKATTLVRDDRVKQKILRIFKIWEDRGVYSEEFISDLCGLISVSPTAPKHDEPHEFQPTYVINKIRVCSNLEADTDLKLKQLKELNPKILETDSYHSSLKDRAHLDDTEKELETYAKYMEDYVNALKAEVKNRINLISVLKQAEGQLDIDRKDVKTVANAYKSFGLRVKTFQKKLEEHKANLVSPIPSPDVNAPSPTSDSDIDLPDGNASVSQDSTASKQNELDFSNVQITNANYYNPVPAPTTDPQHFTANGFTSFIGSNMPFNVQNFNSTELFNTNASTTSTTTTSSGFGSLSSLMPGLTTQPPPPPKPEHYYGNDVHSAPLLPPPMPPFGSKEEANFGYNAPYDAKTDYGPDAFNASYNAENVSYQPSYGGNTSTVADTSYDPITTLFGAGTSENASTFATTGDSEDYNPEEDVQTWEAGDVGAPASWADDANMDTPESPPPFEKEAYDDPMIEYHDNMMMGGAGVGTADVDHRVLLPDLGAGKPKSIGRGQDVDHRNLISLIGSPATDSGSNQLSLSNDGWTGGDQDYRTGSFGTGGGDRDYRFPYDIEQQLKLPPPPPPPPSTSTTVHQIPTVSTLNHIKKNFQSDNVESIDMDLSDDDAVGSASSKNDKKRDNLRVVIDAASADSNSNDPLPKDTDMRNGGRQQLEPPPPFPDLPDDAEEHAFLDQMSKEIDFMLNPEDLDALTEVAPPPFWDNNVPPPPQPRHMQPPPAFPDVTSLPPPPLIPMTPPPGNWMPPEHFQYHNGPPPPPLIPFKNNNKRGKFNNNNNRGGMRGGNNGHSNNGNRGFRGRGGGGRGERRFGRGNFRGNFRGNRGGFS